jgi:hypothetical protein
LKLSEFFGVQVNSSFFVLKILSGIDALDFCL